jgi:membrane fusion protein, multidrug efflux system
MSVSRVVVVLALLAACGGAEEAASPEVRPVRVVTIEERAAGDAVSLTGAVRAAMEVNLALRIDGRMTERALNLRLPFCTSP